MIYADTSAWYAALVPADPDHAQALKWLQTNRTDLLVTDYLVDELLTLLRYRGESRRAVEIGADLFSETAARIEWVTPADVHRAWDIFVSYQDKAWSFTDCVSRVVMERLGITHAFAFDEHFRQFGTVTVVP